MPDATTQAAPVANLIFNQAWLNKTENKTVRATAAGGGAGVTPEGVVWHETVSSGDLDPSDTLNWNLPRRVGSSYNYLIARDGTIYHYVDEGAWVAWHAGAYTQVGAWVGGVVNRYMIGVEFDGKNDGTKITAAQQRAAIQLMLYFRTRWGIPLERSAHVTHKEAVAPINPTYKSDPRGANLDALVAAAQVELAASQEVKLPGGSYTVLAEANVRQDDTRSAPIHSTRPAGFSFWADFVSRGEKIGTEDRWAHLESGEGWIHISMLRPTVVAPTGLTVLAAPRIRKATWEHVLWLGTSPAAKFGAELYAIPLAYGIDPAVALAFFSHESQYGKDGICAEYDLKNWGNVRTVHTAGRGVNIEIPGRGTFARYPTWLDGLHDWCARIAEKYVVGRGLTTVEEITPVYAPSSDNNNPTAYADAVKRSLAAWATMEGLIPADRAFVDPRFRAAWDLSGGLATTADELTPGHALMPAFRVEALGGWVQAYERGSALLADAGVTRWLSIREAIAAGGPL